MKGVFSRVVGGMVFRSRKMLLGSPRWRRAASDERGQTTLEYMVIVVIMVTLLVAIALYLSPTLKNMVKNMISNVVQAISNAGSSL